MNAGDLYRKLSSDPRWIKTPTRVLWIAARFYAGVESMHDLEKHAKPRCVSGMKLLQPLLEESELAKILEHEQEYRSCWNLVQQK